MSAARVTVIAEIGENHLGNMDMARRMIEEAAQAGADVVKFQSYRGADVRDDDPEREWFQQVELSDAAHRDLKAHAEGHGVEFLSSPFSLERARFLRETLGLTKIKVASSEMLNLALLDYLNDRAEVVFLSTGMATLDEVRTAVARLARVKTVAILHCVTQYPTEDHEANLRAIGTLAAAFPEHPIGYSDHTLGIDAAVAAVTLGAAVIEKHFTLAKTLPGTDHVVSTTPEELAEMVRRIRRVEVLLGRSEKTPVPREAAIRDAVRGRWSRT
jgi:sialic acid synthase SpsE